MLGCIGTRAPKGVVYIAKPTANPALLPFFRRGKIKDWRRDVGTLGTKDLSPRNFPPARRSRILLIRDTLTSSRVPRPSRIEQDWNAAYYKHRVISIQTLLIRVNFKDIATLDSGYSFP